MKRRKKDIHGFVYKLVGCFLILGFVINYNAAWYMKEEQAVRYRYETDVSAISDLQSPSCILVEASTGTVLFEKNCDVPMKPASVTKVMTLLLTFEAIHNKSLKLDENVTVSEHAASMGGSQCFFEKDETQTVEDMIKCIIIASGNDAAVAMGEKIAGSETEFVNMMNKKAKELGMKNACFKNACGLDAEGHEMSARDISIMSRELITKYPEVLDYSTIWMDHIVHKTRRGESRFDLVNTNKFLNMYTGATGLKTGYTSTAKYCMSATAERNNISLIAVIMGAETKDVRNKDACRLLDYGFSQCRKYTDEKAFDKEEIKIDNGVKDYVRIKSNCTFEGVLLGDEQEKDVKKEVSINKKLCAPIKKGDVLGSVKYDVGGRNLGELMLTADEDVKKMDLKYAFSKALKKHFAY